jgi:hypothetical protein
MHNTLRFISHLDVDVRNSMISLFLPDEPAPEVPHKLKFVR